jgi:serine/threonine protein kinase
MGALTVNENASSSVMKLPSISALPAGIVLQEFEITGVLGEGGFGIVYLARDRLLGREVAIKEYMPASLAARGVDRGVIVRSRSHEQTFAVGLQSFIAEARLLAQFKHSALVEIFRFWEQNGTAYMAMPFYRGQTLKQYLKSHSSVVNEQWLRALLLPLLDALEHLHSAHCYHRDIAPDNILILENGQPMLLDFGAARRIVGDVADGLTVILKPGYAPVEQYTDDASIAQGPWTDVYGLAAICYLAVTGQVPPASVTRLMRDPLAPLVSQSIPGYSKQLLLGVDRGLAVKPELRPQSIAEFRKLLGLDPQLDLALEETPQANAVRAAQVTASPVGASVIASPAAKKLESLLEITLPPTPSKPDSKRFPFLQSTEGAPKSEPSPVEDVATNTDVNPASSKPKKTSESKRKTAEKNAPPAMSPMDEDTVVLGSKKHTVIEVPEVPGEETDAPVAATRRSTPMIAVAASLVACIVFGAWWFLGKGSPADGTHTRTTLNSSTTDKKGASAPSDTSAAAAATTPEPPLADASKSQSASVSTNTFPTPSDVAAIQERAKLDEQAKLHLEKLAAEDKLKAEEKEKARLAMSGSVTLNILPWGDVFVNGQARGASPPRKRLSLIEGTYTIMIKNGGFEPFTSVVEVKRGQEYSITHQFK